MAFYRDKKVSDFTVISNHILRSKELSLKAKGLLCQILSYPDEWKFSVRGLSAITKDSRDSICTALNELKEPRDTGRKRIFDRILEMCIPVAFSGPSRRASAAAEKYRAAGEFLTA